jgi:5'(3')-deoxyribonucleotidase
MKKQTIAIDIDDVLAASAEGFTTFSNNRWGTHLTPEDYTERWSEMWGVDHEEEGRRAGIIYKSGTVGTFRQFDEAKPVLRQLAKDYKLVITTSRVKHVQKDTLDWIDRHYAGLFEEIHFAGFYDSLMPDSYLMTKADLCKSIGADFLVDDHPKHCIAAADAGIESILFGDYAWNRKIKKLPKSLTRCKDWAAVLRYFNERG